MNSPVVWTIMVAVSVVFGFFQYKADYGVENKGKNLYWKSLELWRHVANYFISGLIVYYFLSTRWPHVRLGEPFSLGDFVIGIVFLVGVMGWLGYFVKNVTEGIQAIFAKLLSK